LLSEPAVPVRFGVPAASVGVGSQGPGAGAPGGEDGQVAGPTRKPGQGLQRDADVNAFCACAGVSAGSRGCLSSAGRTAAGGRERQ
jgi:hypothetical protein